MDRADVHRQVAALHAAHIDQGFLATLGVPFLTLLYRAIDEGEDSVLLVEERGGQVVGFVSGGLGMGPIYKRMLRSPARLAWVLLPSLFRPGRVCRIIDILRYGRRDPVRAGMPQAELLSIVVAPGARGGGVADMLYRRLVGHFAQRGVEAFRITVGDALAPAHRFYARMGATPAGRVEVHAGHGSTAYVHAILSPDTAGKR